MNNPSQKYKLRMVESLQDFMELNEEEREAYFEYFFGEGDALSGVVDKVRGTKDDKKPKISKDDDLTSADTVTDVDTMSGFNRLMEIMKLAARPVDFKKQDVSVEESWKLLQDMVKAKSFLKNVLKNMDSLLPVVKDKIESHLRGEKPIGVQEETVDPEESFYEQLGRILNGK